MDRDAVVKQWTPEARLWDPEFIEQTAGASLALLPDRFDADSGDAMYQEDVAGIVKTVRARGGGLEFAFPKGRRQYISEHGAAEVVTHVGFALIDPLTYDLAKLMLQTVALKVRARLGLSPAEDVSRAEVNVKLARLNSGGPSGVLASDLEISGSVEGVERVLKALIEGGSNDGPSAGNIEET